MFEFNMNFQKKHSDLKYPFGCAEPNSQQHGLHYGKIVTNAVDNKKGFFDVKLLSLLYG